MQEFKPNTNASGAIEISSDGVLISADSKTDWFFHPNGESRQSNVPSLVLETTDPVISIVALVSVEFSGTYDAGTLFVQTAADQWAKLAYELSPQAIPTIVSVVTKMTSDDCDGPRLPGGTVWLRLYINESIVAFHFSEDGKLWRFNRTFSLPREAGVPVKLGLSAQAPLGGGCNARFRAVSVARNVILDFRNGQ